MQGLISRICSLPDADDFFSEKVPTPILDFVESPINLKNLSSKVSHLTSLEVSVLLGLFLKAHVFWTHYKLVYAGTGTVGRGNSSRVVLFDVQYTEILQG